MRKAGLLIVASALALGVAGTAPAIERAAAPVSVTQLVFLPGPIDGQPAMPIGKQTFFGKNLAHLMKQCKAAIAADQATARPYDRHELCLSDTMIPATAGSEDDRPALFNQILNELND